MASTSGIRAGKAYIELSLADEKLASQLKMVERKMQSVGSNIASIGRSVAAFGVAAGAGFLPAIKAASDFGETMSKFDVVFGESSKAMKEFSDTLAGQLGRSRAEIAGFLASSQDLFVPIGFDETKAQELSKTLTTLAVDLASFNNVADADALRDLQAALTGSGETMKKYGVIVSEAAVKNQLLNSSIDPSVATEQQKVMARLQIILAGTSKAQGDATRTADSFANQVKRLQGVMSDLAVSVGQALLPGLTKIVNYLNEAVPKFAEWVKENQTLVVTVAAVAAGLTALGTVLIAVGATISAAGTIVGAFTAALTALGGAAAVTGGIMTVLTGPIGLVALAIGGLVLAIKNFDAIKGVFGKVRDVAVVAFGGIKKAVTGAFSGLLKLGSFAIDTIKSQFVLMGKIAGAVMSKIAAALDYVFGTSLQKSVDEGNKYFEDFFSKQEKRAQDIRQEVNDTSQAAAKQNAPQRQNAPDIEARQKYAESMNKVTAVNYDLLRATEEAQRQTVASISKSSKGTAIALEDLKAWNDQVKRELELDRSGNRPEQTRALATQFSNPAEFIQEANRIRAALKRDEEERKLKDKDRLKSADVSSVADSAAQSQFGGERAAQVFGNLANEQLSIAKRQLQKQQEVVDETKKTRKAIQAGGFVFG